MVGAEEEGVDAAVRGFVERWIIGELAEIGGKHNIITHNFYTKSIWYVCIVMHGCTNVSSCWRIC